METEIKNCEKGSCRHNKCGKCTLEKIEREVKDIALKGRFDLPYTLPVIVCGSFQRI